MIKRKNMNKDNHKITKVMMLIIFIFITHASSAYCGGSTGNITNIEDSGTMFKLIVSIRGKSTLWVGCTVYPPGYPPERDLKPKKIKGSGTVTFNLAPFMANADVIMQGYLDYTVALWENKISLRKCEKKYGKGSERCQWAIKNGYQMEGRLDRRQGKLSP